MLVFPNCSFSSNSLTLWQRVDFLHFVGLGLIQELMALMSFIKPNQPIASFLPLIIEVIFFG